MQVADRELSGRDLAMALEGARACLYEHRDELNLLNVFPIPDGDTGVNMFATMKSAVAAVDRVEDSSVSVIAAAAARGALLGARGNSGVILSQILKGIATGMAGKETFSFSDFAASLHLASEQAYSVICEPVEGTILTVIRESSETASRLADKNDGFVHAITSVVAQARKTVKRTPELLPVLKEAGVVDAGGKGLYYVFKGMEKAICRNKAAGKD